MKELLYSALDLAIIIDKMQLGCQEESHLIDLIWDGEKPFLPEKYRNNKRRLISDIMYWLTYLYEKPIFDKEFQAVQNDCENGNHAIEADRYITDFSNLDLFFKRVRIRILYCEDKYVKIKLRTLVTNYDSLTEDDKGFVLFRKKRKQQSQLLIKQHINYCMTFYHLEATLRGGIPCNIIETTNLDKMLTLHVI